MRFRWHWVLRAGAAVLLALVVGFWLLPKPKVDYMAPEVAQPRELRQAVQDWRAKHPGAPAPDLTRPEERRWLGPDVPFLDPWGSPYLVFYEPEEGDGGEETVVLSFGPDRSRGTLDDIRVPRARVESLPAEDIR